MAQLVVSTSTWSHAGPPPSVQPAPPQNKVTDDQLNPQSDKSISWFQGLGDCEIDLIEPASGAMQKLQHGLRKRAAGLLRAGATYEVARLGEDARACALFTLRTSSYEPIPINRSPS